MRLTLILYAGGNFTSMDSVSALNFARFDGYTWTPLGAGLNGTVSAIAVVKGSPTAPHPTTPGAAIERCLRRKSARCAATLV